MQHIKIGTRGSKLALWQANLVKKELENRNQGITFGLVIIKTEGDKDQLSSLTRIGGQGVFTKAIEKALVDKKIDIAVHSLKDLPSTMDSVLELGAVLTRGNVEDVLITKDGTGIENLAKNAQVATGSARRRAQLLKLRPDLTIQDLRGNIDTRLEKLYSSSLDGILMARAAVERLSIKNIQYAVFSADSFIPAVGQGAIGIQIRKDGNKLKEMVREVNHLATEQAVTAERAMLRRLDSGCQFPVGGYARHQKGNLNITGFVASETGTVFYKRSVYSAPEKAERLGTECAELLIQDGAMDILSSYIK